MWFRQPAQVMLYKCLAIASILLAVSVTRPCIYINVVENRILYIVYPFYTKP